MAKQVNLNKHLRNQYRVNSRKNFPQENALKRRKIDKNYFIEPKHSFSDIGGYEENINVTFYLL